MTSLFCFRSSAEFDLECACEGMSPAGGRLYSGRVSAFLSQHFKRMPDIRQAYILMMLQRKLHFLRR